MKQQYIFITYPKTFSHKKTDISVKKYNNINLLLQRKNYADY